MSSNKTKTTENQSSVKKSVMKSHKYDLSDQTVADIKQSFEQFVCEGDNGVTDGRIQTKQLKFALRALGFEPKKEEINKMIEQIDKTKTGFISYEDFFGLMAKKFTEKDTNDEIMKAFQLFDFNKNGNISYEDLKRVAKELGETLTDEELREMITEADRDADGVVSCQEFLRIMKKTCLY